MVIDSFSILDMTLKPATHTTSKRVFLDAVHLVDPVQQRQKIARHSRFRILLSQDVIIKCTCIVVGHGNISSPVEYMSAKFQHIVRAACFTSIS